MSRIDRQERTGASWRDLESANVVAQMKDHIITDIITEDSSVAEFLDPSNWNMASVRIAWDHTPRQKLRLARIDGEWLSLHKLSCDEEEKGESV